MHRRAEGLRWPFFNSCHPDATTFHAHISTAFSALANACYDFEMSHTLRFLSPEFPLTQRAVAAVAAVAPVAKRPSIEFVRKFTFAFD